MPSDVDIWLSDMARATLTRIGMISGQTVVDFGCGPGYTAIPAAAIVGETGRVYAVEKSRLDLLRLARLAKSSDIANIIAINTHGGLDLPFGAKTIDLILAFDVLLPHYFGGSELAHVIDELHRVSRPGGTLAVFPSHVAIEDIQPLISGAGFAPSARFILPVLHNRTIEQGGIFTFTADGER